MIRIGLLGASRISRSAIIKPATDIDGVEVSRVAARDRSRAAAFAAEHGIAGTEADYDALCRSEQVDVVYNGLPPSEHAHWSIAALEAGKHVLCEKPFAMNADEAQRMVDAADRSRRVLIEAFHYRFHPLFDRVLLILQSGDIGAIERIDATFCVPIANRPGELRYIKDLGGGAMMDLGCYPVHWVRTIMNAEPEVLSAEADWDESGVDVVMRAEFKFPDGVRAFLHSAMSVDLPNARDAKLTVQGSNGQLTVDNPLSPHDGHRLTVTTDERHFDDEVAGGTTYYHQLQHLLAVLAGDAAQITGGADAVSNMRVLDDIYRLAGAVGS